MTDLAIVKAEYRAMMLRALGHEGPIKPYMAPEPAKPQPKAKAKKAKAKANTWVAPRRTRDDHPRPSREPNDFTGRTSRPLVYLPALEIDSMWHGSRGGSAPPI